MKNCIYQPVSQSALERWHKCMGGEDVCVVLVVWVGTQGRRGRAHQPPATRVNVTGFWYCILCCACHTSTYPVHHSFIHPSAANQFPPLVKQVHKYHNGGRPRPHKASMVSVEDAAVSMAQKVAGW